MKTMTNRYIPTWERQYDPWDKEPDTWELDEIESNDSDSDEIPLDSVDEKDLAIEFDESEFDLDIE